MDVTKSLLFVPWKDPESKVTSFILDARVAPVQKTFYFTNPSFDKEQRCFWFMAAFPPGRQLTLAMADLKTGEVQHYPAVQMTGRPWVDDERNGCYFSMGSAIWFQDADGSEPEKIAELAPEVIGHRYFSGIPSHNIKSADGRRIGITGRIGDRWFLGYAELASGEMTILRWFDRNTDHEAYSPTDPHLLLFCQDWWRDFSTGEYHKMDNRMWVIRDDGGEPEALIPDEEWGVDNCAHHEWWGPDGNWMYYCDNTYHPGDPINVLRATGVKRVNIKTHTQEMIWEDEVTHAHCDATEQHFVGDFYSYLWRGDVPAEVRYFDKETGKSAKVCSGMPVLKHLDHSFQDDPHPLFSPQGNYIVYTTTVRGKVDIAVTPVDEVRSRL